MDNKQCTKCLVSKPITEFYFIKRSNSHDARCKSCVKLYMGTRKEYIASYNKKRYRIKVMGGWRAPTYDEKTDKQKAQQYQHLKAWRVRNKGKCKQEARLGMRLRRSKAYLQYWNLVIEQYGSQCLCCGATDRPLCFDHVVPLSMNGTNDITNGQPLCRRCNTFKGHIDPEKDYRKDKGALIIEMMNGINGVAKGEWRIVRGLGSTSARKEAPNPSIGH